MPKLEAKPRDERFLATPWQQAAKGGKRAARAD